MDILTFWYDYRDAKLSKMYLACNFIKLTIRLSVKDERMAYDQF